MTTTAKESDPFGSSYGPDYWLRRCEGFTVETPTKRIGRVTGLRYGRSQEPESLEVRAGRIGRKLLLISVKDVELVDPVGKRIVLGDRPRLLSE